MNLRREVVIAGVIGILAGFGVGAAHAVYVYPAKGQSQEQIQRDKFECNEWAKKQTGFDPAKRPTASGAPASSPPQGGLLRGAARGAALGAIGGAIAGDAGTGAAVGAGVGAAGGAMRRRDSMRQQEAARMQADAQYEAALNGFNRAYAACLTGRGYTVQ